MTSFLSHPPAQPDLVPSSCTTSWASEYQASSNPFHGIRRHRSGAVSWLWLPPPARTRSLCSGYPGPLRFQAHAPHFVLAAPFPGTPLRGYLHSLLPHLLLVFIYWSLLRATSMNPFFLQHSPQSSSYSSQWHLSSPDIMSVYQYIVRPPPPMDRTLHEDTTVPPEPGMASPAQHALCPYLLDE